METLTVNLFYPLLFTVLIVLIVAICSVIKSRNGNMTFKDMFCVSSNNAKEVTIDTTGKMRDMHSDVVDGLPIVYHKELNIIHSEIKDTNDRIEELANNINEKLDMILLSMQHK